MQESTDSRLEAIEARVARLEQRFENLLSKLSELKRSAGETVQKMSRIAAAAEAMSDSTRRLLRGRHTKH